MPGDPQHWVFDAEGIPRVVTTTSTGLWSDKTKITHWYRQSIDGDWQQLGTFSFIEDHWIPVYLMEDGKSLAVTSRHGRDTWAYFRFDLETRRIADMGSLSDSEQLPAGRGKSQSAICQRLRACRETEARMGSWL